MKKWHILKNDGVSGHKNFNLIMHSVHKVVIQALKILQQMLKDFQRVFDHFADIRCYSVK